MAVGPGTLRVSYRSIMLAVAGLGVTLLALRMAVAATRVLGWIAAAAIVAGLLDPVVARLARRVPRGLAVLAVTLVLLGTIGVTGYGVAASLVRQNRALQAAAPGYARQLESSPRFGDLARDAGFEDRTRKLVEAIPRRLQGGSAAEAIRATATRGVAFLATAILSLFFLLHGPRLAAAATAQIRDPRTRAEVTRVAGHAFTRAFGYARGSLAQAVVAGMVGYATARIAGVPGAAPLGLWVALWDLVPLVGVVFGGLPIVLIAGVISDARGLAAAAVFLALQAIETLVLQRRLERRTLRLGPFLTVVAGFAGLELYGLGGALVTVLAVTLLVAVLDELADALDEHVAQDEERDASVQADDPDATAPDATAPGSTTPAVVPPGLTSPVGSPHDARGAPA